MIIGTAGHIDHGKTTLVRALTGVDTDRLKEEKARGISIELGYAYSSLAGGPLAGGEVLGFIDVPGHERLVHTMVAGACGIDFALLVVAADDGVMPQTREHLAILGLLGVSNGAVALTKVDRVGEERLHAVKTEIAATLASTALSAAPVFALNATVPDDPGTESLRQHLHATAARFPMRRAQGLFRLAVDRVFTLPGHGTVVTGTVFSGEIAVGDTVSVMPSGVSVRVRSIHAQNRASDMGRAGQRCALNLAGIETSQIARGNWLAAPEAFTPTTRLDVALRLLSGGDPSRLTSWTPLHVHLGTWHRVGHVVPLESTRVQLVFDTPICATPGDRFIVRDAQAIHTVGGGVVLDPFAPSRRRRSDERLRRLDALEKWVTGEGVASLLENAPHGLRLSELVQLTGLAAGTIPLPPGTVTVESPHERFVLDPAHWSALRQRATHALREFHAQVPDDPGPDIGRLRRIALPDFPDALWRALITALVQEGVIVRSGPWLHLPQHRVALSEADQVLVRKLHPLIATGRFNPPWVRDLAVVSREPEERVREVLRKSVTQGAVYQVVRDLFYDRECIGELATIIDQLAREHGAVDAARYRDALGLGRKRTIQILEFFDRVGYTRRVKDSHVLRPDSCWKVHAPGGAAGLQTQEGASDASW
jgi:selenocysteine-specific elongation factor